MTEIIPLGRGRVCDRCADEYITYPGGKPQEAARLSVHTNYDPFRTKMEHGGLPHGDLCPSCLHSYVTWWTAGGNDEQHAAEERAYIASVELPDMDAHEEADPGQAH
jgi:hypothetical protein